MGILEIKELYLGHFGKFEKKELVFGEGINVIQGANEAGKSTIHSFIRGMFFGIEKKRGREAKGDLYSKYQPWETPGAYQGSMVIEKEGSRYQISRNFLQKERSVSVTDMATGREISERELSERGLFEHFNETVYRNTISIEQLKAATEKEFAGELQNYIANLSMTRSNEVDIAGALQRLKEKKKGFDSGALEARDRELSEQIAVQEQRVARHDELTAGLQELLLEQERSRREFEEQRKDFLGEKAADIGRMLEKYASYQALTQELAKGQESLEDLDRRIQKIEEVEVDSAALDTDLKHLNHLKEEAQAFELSRNRELDIEEEALNREGREKRLGCITAAVTGLLVTIITAVLSVVPGIAIGILVMLLAGVLYLVMAARMEKKYQALQEKKQEAVSEQLRLEGEKKEILVRNYVLDVEGLRKKYNTRVAEEVELRHLKERRQEISAEQERRKAGRQQFAAELVEYRKALQPGTPEAEELSEQSMKSFAEQISVRQRAECQAADNYRGVQEELRSREEHIRWEMSTLAGAAVQLEELKKQRAECQTAIQAAEEECGAVELAMDVIKELSAEIHDSFGENLNRSISEKVAEITAGAYNGIVMDEQLAVRVGSKNGYLSLDKLSAGTNCQVYLAVRMAMAELFFPEEVMPLLFDDVFALYDDARTEAALDYLAQTGRQILLFTCHTREARLLEKMGIPHTLLRLDTST